MNGYSELVFTNSAGNFCKIKAGSYAEAVALVLNMGMDGWYLKNSKVIASRGKPSDNTEMVRLLVEEYLA